jgi:hypothetical protein
MITNEAGHFFCKVKTGFTLALLLLKFPKIVFFWGCQCKLVQYYKYCNKHKRSFGARALCFYYKVRGGTMTI